MVEGDDGSTAGEELMVTSPHSGGGKGNEVLWEHCFGGTASAGSVTVTIGWLVCEAIGSLPIGRRSIGSLPIGFRSIGSLPIGFRSIGSLLIGASIVSLLVSSAIGCSFLCSLTASILCPIV